jgi:hypothetical protein
MIPRPYDIYIYRISADGIEKIDALDLGLGAIPSLGAYEHIRVRYLPTALDGDFYFATSAENGRVLGYWKVSVQKSLTLASV